MRRGAAGRSDQRLAVPRRMAAHLVAHALRGGHLVAVRVQQHRFHVVADHPLLRLHHHVRRRLVAGGAADHVRRPNGDGGAGVQFDGPMELEGGLGGARDQAQQLPAADVHLLDIIF